MSKKLADNSEILFRQVHPTWIDGGEPTSLTFIPSAKDQNKLSLDRSSLTSAENAHVLYTRNGSLSAAVYGLSVGEFSNQNINCEADPIDKTDSQEENPAHAIADYSEFGTSAQRKIAKKLKRNAAVRGCLYKPPAGT